MRRKSKVSIAVLVVGLVVSLAAFGFNNPEEMGPLPPGVRKVSPELPRSKNTVAYIDDLESRGSDETIKAASLAAPKLVQTYMSLFRYPPGSADSRAAVHAELARRAQVAGQIVVPSSPADRELAHVRSFAERTARRVQGYSDNSSGCHESLEGNLLPRKEAGRG